VRPLAERRAMIEQNKDISMVRQCELLCIHRSGLYYRPVPESEENLLVMRMMDEQRFNTPFYGSRRLREWLEGQGYRLSRNRVRRLMRLINWQTLYRLPNTSWKDKSHWIYPYLLKGLKICRANQVWAIDITYIPMRRGFMYLCAVIDLHTRYVVNWSVGNTMSAEWCCTVVKEAIALHGEPEIINSDQGSQFTSMEYTSLFANAKGKPEEVQGMKISMDGKGRYVDNIFIERLWKSVKYECVYLNAFEDGLTLYKGLADYFRFYNNERMHQSLDYKTPASMYQPSLAGGSQQVTQAA
jgi:putative transposase